MYTYTQTAVPRVLRYFAKVIFQTINLLWVIFAHTKKPSHVLVQVCDYTAIVSVINIFAGLYACVYKCVMLHVVSVVYGYNYTLLMYTYVHVRCCMHVMFPVACRAHIQ